MTKSTLKLRLFASAAAVGAMLAAPHQAAAQASASDAPDAQGAVIMVTARKISENIQTVPIAMTQFSGDALERQTVRSLGDVQYQLPNVQIQQSSGDPQAFTLAIRGQRQNDTPPTVDPSVGVYIDGVYYPRTIGLKGALVDVDHMEVLRGPQGTLYGRNTTGGAFSVFTKNPTDEFEGFVAGDVGNYDLFSGSAMINVPLAPGLAFRVVGQATRRDGYGRDDAGQQLNEEKSHYIRGKLRAEIGDAEVVLSFTNQKNEAGSGNYRIVLAPASVTGTVDGGSATFAAMAELGLPFTPEGIAQAIAALRVYEGRDPYRGGGTYPSRSGFVSNVTSLDVKIPLTDDINFRSITSYQHLKRNTSGDNDGTPFDILALRFTNDGRYASQEFQLLGGDKHFNWVIGAYAGDEKQDYREAAPILSGLTGGSEQRSNTKIHNQNIAGFAQVIWEFLPKTRFTGGFRYSSDKRQNISSNSFGPPGFAPCTIPAPGVIITGVPTDPDNGPSQCPRKFEATFSKPSWLVSLDHQFTPDLFGYAKVAYGFRTGGLNHRGANLAASFAPFGPETVTEYEVGAKWDIVPRVLRANIAVFHDDYKGIQRSITTPGPGGRPLALTTNAASGKIDGVELETTLTPVQGLTILGSMGYLDARYKKFVDLTGDRSKESFGVPKWTASTSVSYAIPTSFGRVTPQLDFHWQSRIVAEPTTRFLISSVTQKAYGLLNGRLSVDIDSMDLTAAIWGKNITDKVYLSNAVQLETSLGFNQQIFGEPRTYGVSLMKRF